jgi:uncharacterized protein YhaN
MILRSVELESFGKFRNQTIEFRRGMNLVIGPNETGKSTLAEAVPAVLFGTDHLEKFKPWGRNSCVAALFFEGRGRTVQVKRNLITDDVELIEKDDLYHILSQFSGKAPLRGRTSACREFRDLLESLIGISDEKLFRATYFFGHHPQDWKGDELAHKLRSLVSGTAEADYAAILDNLLEDHFALTRSNPWGRDKQRDREYEEVCRQLAEQADRQAVPVFVEIDNTAELSEQLARLTDELANDRQEHAKGLRYLARVRSDLETRQLAAARSDQAAPQTQTAAPATTPGPLSDQLMAVGLPSSPPRELPEILSEASAIRQELAALQQPLSLLNSREQKIPRMPWIGLASSIFALGLSAATAWWQDLQFFWVATGTAAVTAGLLGWGGWRYYQAKKASNECRNERSRLDRKKQAALQHQAELSERCESLGLPSSAIDLVRIQKLVTKHRDLLESFWNQDRQASGAERSKLSPEDDVNGDLPGAELLPNTLAEKEEELQQLETRMTAFEAGLQQKETRLQELRDRLHEQPDGGEKARVTTPVKSLQARKDQLEDEIAILRHAINLLAEAVDRFSKSHLLRLNEASSKLFEKMTGGRYPVLQLDENMTPSIRVEDRRWVPFEHFSRGTIDAIYLALRIALVGIRGDRRSLPLLLDDPFVHLDQKRLAATMNLLDLASADGQMILFSHNLELGKRAARERWHVVPLDGDRINDNTGEGDEHASQLHLL